MVRNITDEDWNFLEKKFGKLVHYTVWRIPNIGYLDKVDKTAEVSNVMLKAVESFTPEEGGSDVVSEFIKTERFASYVKTCIWHKMSYLTKTIYKRRSIDGDNVSLSSLSHDYLESNENLVTVSGGTTLRDIELPKELNELALEIMSDLSNFKKSGVVNISKISRDLNIPPSKTRKLLASLKTALEMQID